MRKLTVGSLAAIALLVAITGDRGVRRRLRRGFEPGRSTQASFHSIPNQGGRSGY